MKKNITLILAVVLCLSVFTACGKKSSPVKERSNYLIESFGDYITLAEYKGLTLDYTESTVTDDQVESKIQSNLEGAAEKVEITDRAIENGDTVNFDFVGKYKDSGEAFDGGSAEGYELVIGSGQFIPGFEENLIGHKPGDSFSFDITFPEDYSNAELANVETTFDIVINKILEDVTPELNDDFVGSQEIDGVKTVDEYKKYVRSQLEDNAVEQAKSSKISAIWNVVMKDSTVIKYPENELNAEVEKQTKSLESELQQYGMTVDDYINQSFEGDSEKYNSQLTEQAKSNVKSYMIVYAIADELDINITESDYQDGLNEYYGQYEEYCKTNSIDPEYKSVDEFASYAEQNDLAFFLLYEKVSEKLLELNTFTPQAETSIEDYISTMTTDESAGDEEIEPSSSDSDATDSSTTSEETASEDTTADS